MSERPQIKLSETVALIDGAFLNFVITDMKDHFEKALHRTLPEIYLSTLTTYLTLDAGIAGSDNEVQFLFVYDKENTQLQHCQPSDLEKDLNGVAFQSPYGEYSFAGVPCEEMVSIEDLFLDLLSIIADSTDVKKVIVISFNEQYGNQVTKALNEMKGKEIVQFRMTEPDIDVTYRWEVLFFPILQAFGVQADEL